MTTITYVLVLAAHAVRVNWSPGLNSLFIREFLEISGDSAPQTWRIVLNSLQIFPSVPGSPCAKTGNFNRGNREFALTEQGISFSVLDLQDTAGAVTNRVRRETKKVALFYSHGGRRR